MTAPITLASLEKLRHIGSPFAPNKEAPLPLTHAA
jgi:hypothetical protein